MQQAWHSVGSGCSIAQAKRSSSVARAEMLYRELAVLVCNRYLLWLQIPLKPSSRSCSVSFICEGSRTKQHVNSMYVSCTEASYVPMGRSVIAVSSGTDELCSRCGFQNTCWEVGRLVDMFSTFVRTRCSTRLKLLQQNVWTSKMFTYHFQMPAPRADIYQSRSWMQCSYRFLVAPRLDAAGQESGPISTSHPVR